MSRLSGRDISVVLLLTLDDDDDFLYGGSVEPEKKVIDAHTTGKTFGDKSGIHSSLYLPQPVSFDKTITPPNGVVAHLEAVAEKEASSGDDEREPEAAEEDEDEESADQDAEDSESDVEIIMEPQSRSLDLRNTPGRPPVARSISTTTPVKAPQPSLTTEYTPIQRGGIPQTPQATPLSTAKPGPSQTPVHSQPQTASAPQASQLQANGVAVEDGPDTSTLPPVTAPPSHPSINPDIPGTLDGRSILEMDMSAMADKPWRRAGSDLSDWFNYGFDELSWEAYCYRRRGLAELGNALKQNVLNFSGMPEDQLTALPPEVRQMVMTGATAILANGGNPAMMGAGVGMNPMMDMSGMMGGMPMGMNGEMGMAMQPGGPMMDGRQMAGMIAPGQEGVGPAQGPGGSGTPDQQGVVGGAAVGMGNQMMGEGFPAGAPGQMMQMNMGGDFNGMQDQSQMNPQMFQNMEGQPNMPPAPQVVPQQPTRGIPQMPFRGRGQRGRGYPARGRGRGGIYGGDAASAPVRPASPLPPGVPTGPRNQNKYKDRDNNAAAVDGLDYGGTAKEGGVRTPSGEPEDRSSSRKRRGSPGQEDMRSSKRR
ncbi:hypothetical protein HGRIS_008508 [Hohenbuehelia grisea]|uniref:Pre-mRNA polyadenylation factor Fip1 domain-containing protein n=1 Tax=Hohenbuehelia grisea TaxID=104357 RepID=A0ABR3J8C3_9AGAR